MLLLHLVGGDCFEVEEAAVEAGVEAADNFCSSSSIEIVYSTFHFFFLCQSCERLNQYFVILLNCPSLRP